MAGMRYQEDVFGDCQNVIPFDSDVRGNQNDPLLKSYTTSFGVDAFFWTIRFMLGAAFDRIDGMYSMGTGISLRQGDFTTSNGINESAEHLAQRTMDINIRRCSLIVPK